MTLFLESRSLGVAGYKATKKEKMIAEKFDAMGNLINTGWASNSEFENPVCLTLWQGHPDVEESKCITKWTSSFVPSGNSQDYEMGREYDSYSTVSYLKSNLDRIKSTSSRSLMLGFGWSVEMNALGGKSNERIPLVEFNPRALVHSNQHGQGGWFGNTNKYSSKNYFENDSIAAGGNDTFKYDVQLQVDDFYREQFSYEVNGKTFVFNTFNSQYKPQKPKSYPDVFELPETADQEIPGTFNTTENVISRSVLLGLTQTNKINSGIPIFPASSNLDFVNLEVPASQGLERVGFFAKKNILNKPYSGKFSDSSRAVLFDIPEGKILSLLQYRHANLNNYLQSSNYALGNSYASTQVGRHRSWGRVQNMESKPTSEQGLLNLVQNSRNRDLVKDYYEKNLPGGLPFPILHFQMTGLGKMIQLIFL